MGKSFRPIRTRHQLGRALHDYYLMIRYQTPAIFHMLHFIFAEVESFNNVLNRNEIENLVGITAQVGSPPHPIFGCKTCNYLNIINVHQINCVYPSQERKYQK